MSMNIIDAFVVTFGLDDTGFKKGEREVDAATKRLRENSKRTFDEMEGEGKKLGESLKNVRNEVVGLGLAFMGARSITGLIGNMMTGAATADRFGTTLGMNAKQVWAWRMAMKGVGGQVGEGDAALGTIQNAKMGWKMHGDTGANTEFGLLGIGKHDLENSDAGAILKKIAGMQGKMDPQRYAQLLHDIGLPQSTIYFLQQGKDSVDKLLKQYEGDANGQEKLAKETEQLQQSLVNLQTTILKDLVPPLTKLANILNNWIGGGSNPAPADGSTVYTAPGILGDIFTLKRGGKGAAKHDPSATQDPAGDPNQLPSLWGGKGKTRADRNNNPGNIVDGSFARSQPGYAGSDGRFAKFSSADAGMAAMEKLLGGYMARGRNTIASIVSRWAPSSENNTGAYVARVSKMTGLNAHQPLTRAHIHALATAMAKHEGFSGGGVHIQHLTVNTKATDANGIARDIHGALKRRHAVSQADRGVNA